MQRISTGLRRHSAELIAKFLRIYIAVNRRAPIRILFAFDPKQQAVIILGGSKQNDKRWYNTNIPIAEKLFKEHL
ncbi:MAG: type II toxin-antitoxin system RelE/ParE family toxin, partial [Candidatus Obscuribacterales bacterium]|nr:type II toxin-antitoxin system RelE/ParE family toxin [Candidatus Obscuribacterales bacterium]